MSHAPASSAITFVVNGQSMAPSGATRGAGSALIAPSLAGKGSLIQRVQLGARRSAGAPVRLTARPGQDAVVLHISNGPSLMLHPETARDLLLAQSGRPKDRETQASRGAKGADTSPAEVVVSAQLTWQGLEQAGATRGVGRGRLGEVLLSAIDLVTDLMPDSTAEPTAQVIGALVDHQVDAGVYPLDSQGFEGPLKGRVQRLDRIPAAPHADARQLVLLHGTFSETHGTFGKLWRQHPKMVRDLFTHYADRVYGFDHPTLLASPIDNALMLAKSLPDGARVDLLTHSRGGLVAEILARLSARPELSATELGLFKGREHQAQLSALRALAAELKGRGIRIERMVRVACPARGTLLASRRLDAYVSVLAWALELANIPVAPALIDFLAAVARQRTDPRVLPGLEAMAPDNPLVQWLHTSASGSNGALSSELCVVAGDIEGDSITSWVKTLLADAFYWTDNDLVVQTRSMYGGTPRAATGGQAGASFLLDQGGKVSHFNYFSNERTAQAVCNALQADRPAGFQPIGPLSWAGSSSDGLRGAPVAPGGKPPAERPALILLPGILGSHLRVDNQRIWLSLRMVGGLPKLAYEAGATNVQADGAIGDSYGALSAHLAASHHVIEFSYDWRRPIEDEARRLAEVMDKALTERTGSGQPVRLLAHSAGGLIARTVELECPAIWQRWLGRAGSRLLMLGTPNGGSFAPMQVLSGDDPLGNTLVAFGLPFQDQEARQIMANMPGLMQLQASLLDPKLGLGQRQRWLDLASQDLEKVRQASGWHNSDIQRNAYRWGIPPQDVLDAATDLRRRLDAQRDNAEAEFKDRLLLVVGQARYTTAGFEMNEREGLVYLDVTDTGDGRVTLDNALLPGARTWRVDCEHGDLAGAESAFKAYLELLENGDTQRLPVVQGAAVRGAATAAGAAALVRSRPSRERQRNFAPPVARRDVFSAMPMASTAATAPGAALRVTVHNGNLKFVSTALMVGHYGASTLTGTEYVVDQFIGGAMSASLAIGLYPEAPGSHQFFLNQRQDPDNPLALPRPPHAIVVGLGEEGKLRPGELSQTVRQATLAWAQRLAESPEGDAAQFELSATMIGSGGIGVSVAASAQAMAQGVREANEKLVKGGWPQVTHLHLIELYLDRATEAWLALNLLSQTAQDHYVLSPVLRPGVGALRKPLESGYRGTGHDFISAISEKNEDGEPTITYSLDTQRARSEARMQSTQARLVTELVRRASNDANRDPSIGRTLFQLLVPAELEASLRGSSELLLELNDGTAAIPWELLDAPQDGHSGATKPWAIRNKMMRKLRTVQFRAQVRDARLADAVLVIGEPKCDPALYPPLPGARAEAQAVCEALRSPTGLDPERVHALIAPDDFLGPDATAVTAALLARPYRIVHIAGHGEPEHIAEGKKPEVRGVVLSDNTYLGPREVEAMRVVPELVFLNCCHLADGQKHLLRGYDRASFAASVAKQLIRIGVRCVVAAGWAVEDEAASHFASAFYQSVLRGDRFMDAVHAGRVAAYDANPRGNTWAAYQCYGDPEWVWHADPHDTHRARPPIGQEYSGIASPVALTLALETLAVQSATQGRSDASQCEKIRYLESRFEVEWGGMGAVAESFGVAFAAAHDLQRARRWYQRAVAANDGSASIKSSEQVANIGARLAWDRIHRLMLKNPEKPVPQAMLAAGRKAIQQAIAMLNALLTLAPSIERESLLGSAYKRLAQIEGVAQNAQAERRATVAMAAHYRRAEDIARRSGDGELFYPALNRLAGELVAHSITAKGASLSLSDVQDVRQSLKTRVRENPNFWSVVGLPELSLLEALAAGDLPDQLPGILAAYEDLQSRVGTPWMWASVADQTDFVVRHFNQGRPAHVRAVHQLQSQLRKYAGR
jgi:CHAT domain-containing protein